PHRDAGQQTQILRQAIRDALTKLAPEEVETFDLISQFEPRREETTFEPEIGETDPESIANIAVIAQQLWIMVQPAVEQNWMQIGTAAAVGEGVALFRGRWQQRIAEAKMRKDHDEIEKKVDALIAEVVRNVKKSHNKKKV
ncbi:MAG: hypothetical protein AAGD47_00870, partial [Pseudomonadota bacterium]